MGSFPFNSIFSLINEQTCLTCLLTERCAGEIEKVLKVPKPNYIHSLSQQCTISDRYSISGTLHSSSELPKSSWSCFCDPSDQQCLIGLNFSFTQGYTPPGLRYNHPLQKWQNKTAYSDLFLRLKIHLTSCQMILANHHLTFRSAWSHIWFH